MSEQELLLAECVEDYHSRRALREPVRPEDYRERLGDLFSDFLDVLEAEERLDLTVNLAPEAPFPRPFGNYTLVRELGRGSMGVVYEAVHRPLGRKVALKILRTGFDTESLALERFRREARTCAQVRHECVIEIYEAGDVEGRPYFTMPFMSGRTLADHIRAGDLIPPRDLFRGLAGVASGLAALHEVGIVHRDVKPGNILVDDDGRMILGDLGLARSAASQSITQTGYAPGTPLYMSPEQILGQPDRVDHRSDIYGLGATAYEALTGERPFKAESIHELIRMVVSEDPRPVRDVAPRVPRECAFVAEKAMERKPDDRYQSANDMRDDFEAFAAGEPVSGRPVSRLRRTWRRHRHRILMAAAVLIAVFGYVAWSRARPGVLQVDSLPSQAMLVVDGTELGPTPFDDELRPGSYEVECRKPGYESRFREVVVSAGENTAWDPELHALQASAGDTTILGEIAAFCGLRQPDIPDPKTRTGGGGDRVRVLFPRGRLRVEDLVQCRVELARMDYEPDGEIQFRRGDEVLFQTPYREPEKVSSEFRIPESVREALRPSDIVTWGYFPGTGEPVITTFRIISPEQAEEARTRIDALESRLEHQPALLTRHLRNWLYFELELDQAALNEARAIVSERADSLWGWAVYRESLRRMELLGTRLATRDVASGLEQFSAEERDRVFRPSIR